MSSPGKSPAKKKQAGPSRGHSHRRDHRLAHDGGRDPSILQSSNAASHSASGAPRPSGFLHQFRGQHGMPSMPMPSFPSVFGRPFGGGGGSMAPRGVITLDGAGQLSASSNDSPLPAASGLTPSVDAATAAEVDRAFSTDLVVRVKQRLGRKEVEGKADTFGQKFLKTQVMDKLVERRAYLLKLAKGVDKERKNGGAFYFLLREALPGEKGVNKSISKAAMIDFMVNVWRVLQVVLDQGVELSREHAHALQVYIGIMERTVSSAMAAMEEERTSDANAKSLKCPKEEESRGYLQGGAFLPEKEYRRCAKCGGESVHEPPENKEKKKRNKTKTTVWTEQSKHLAELKGGKRTDPLLDKNQVPITKLPNPTLEDLLLVCKAEKMKHSLTVDGYKCKYCTDRSCKTCQSNCRFVTSKRQYKEKKLYFEMKNEHDAEARSSAAEEARDFLDNAGKTRQEMAEAEKESLLEARRIGAIARGTTDADIAGYSEQVGHHNAATFMLSNPPSTAAFSYLSQKVSAAEHPKGATYTKAHGDLRGASAAKQRGKNTGLTDPASFHGLAGAAAGAAPAAASAAAAAAAGGTFADDDSVELIPGGGKESEEERAAREVVEAEALSLMEAENAKRSAFLDEEIALAERRSMEPQYLPQYLPHQQFAPPYHQQHPGGYGGGPPSFGGYSAGHPVPPPGPPGQIGSWGGARGITPPPPPRGLATPAPPTATGGPAPAPAPDAEDPTPVHVSDVRDEAQMEIMGEREEDAEPLDGNDCQLVVEGLSRPYDPQMLNANKLLHKKGRSTRERLVGMTKLAKIRGKKR